MAWTDVGTSPDIAFSLISSFSRGLHDSTRVVTTSLTLSPDPSPRSVPAAWAWRLHPAWILVEQVAQVGRRRLRVGDGQEHGRTAIMPETTVGTACKR